MLRILSSIPNMHFEDYYLGGMHFLWWLIWLIFLIWIFCLPYDIPGQCKHKDTPIHILKRRLALGEITNEEYATKKKIIGKN